MTRIISFLVYLCLPFYLSAQITIPGTPKSFNEKKRSSLKVYTLAPFEIDTLELKEKQNYEFAKVFDVNINSKHHGKWTSLKNGDRLWKLLICSQGAVNLNFLFEDFNLPKGGELYLYSKNGSHVLGAITSLNNKKTKKLATVPIKGDSVIVEYFEPADASFHADLNITRIGHGYKNIYEKKSHLKSAGSCNLDISCSDNEKALLLKQTVCKIIYNNNEHCTGTLINNTKEDQTPYILTAGHCIKTEEIAESSVYIFDYENSSCGESDAITSLSISGSTLIATDEQEKIDFTLVRLSESPPSYFLPYYAGWNIEDKVLDSAFTIHHPRGDAKKYSAYHGEVTTDTYPPFIRKTHWKVARWDIGTTEGGSSGAPLFNKNGQLFGTLTGGEANCKTPVNDYFQKLTKEWDYYSPANRQLKSWLDPLNLGITSLNLLIPNTSSQNPFSHFTENDTAVLFDFGTKAEGYWTSQNEIGFDAIASKYINVEHRNIYGLRFPLKYAGNNISANKLTIWKGTVHPSSIIYQEAMDEENIKEGLYQVYFDEPIATTGMFFIGIQFSAEEKDTLALYAKEVSFFENTSYIKKGNTWNGNAKTGMAFSLAIEVFATNQTDTLTQSSIFPTDLFSNISQTSKTRTTKELFENDLISNFDTSTYYTTPKISDENGFWLGTNKYGAESVTENFYFETPQTVSGIWLDVAESSSGNITVEISNNQTSLLDTLINCENLRGANRNFILLKNRISCVGSMSITVRFSDAQWPFSLAMYSNDDQLETGSLNVKGDVFRYSDFILPESAGFGFSTCYSDLFYSRDSIYYDPIKKDNYTNQIFSISTMPAPVAENFRIKLKNCPGKDVLIRIFSSAGKMVFAGNWQATNGFIVNMSAQSLAQGIYFINAQSEGKSASCKLVVSRLTADE